MGSYLWHTARRMDVLMETAGLGEDTHTPVRTTKQSPIQENSSLRSDF